MIFGQQIPKFKTNAGTIEFNHALLDYDYVIPDIIEHVSVFDGTRNYLNNKDYADFRITIYLNKYASPKVKLQEIYSYNHTYGWFYPHKDDVRIKRLYHLEYVKPFYLDTPDFYDMCTVVFRGKDHVRLFQDAGYGTGYGTGYGERL